MNNDEIISKTILKKIMGISYVDATIAGLGRGAGNCPLELMLGFLKNPKFHIRQIIKCVEDQIVALRKEVSWGFDIPYMVTDQLNQHPRAAISFFDEKRNDIVNFYDSIVNGD